MVLAHEGEDALLVGHECVLRGVAVEHRQETLAVEDDLLRQFGLHIAAMDEAPLGDRCLAQAPEEPGREFPALLLRRLDGDVGRPCL